jgi:peptidoglycan/xylan/chitin deacetylase (PgdA/CDA1 family)
VSSSKSRDDRPPAARVLTVIMYHFVRDLAASRYPEIKGLTLEAFKGQVAFVRRHYAPVSVQEVLAALEDPGTPLPAGAVLLTFDDGYRDHCDHVLPVLLDNGMPGCFFPPAKAVTEHQVLDVNKIHFILASEPDKGRIIDSLFEQIDEVRADVELRTRDEYERDLAHPGRYDTADVILIKRLLQRDLPEMLRRKITDRLFREYVSDDEAAFSRELYMSVDDLRDLRRAGMWIGSHGYDHYWLDSLDPAAQQREIDLSMKFMRDIGCDTERWVMGYPYGAYSESLLTLLRQRGCSAGFTTEVRIADLAADDPLTLPRLDTNDLPKRADDPPNVWTTRAGVPRSPG